MVTTVTNNGAIPFTAWSERVGIQKDNTRGSPGAIECFSSRSLQHCPVMPSDGAKLFCARQRPSPSLQADQACPSEPSTSSKAPNSPRIQLEAVRESLCCVQESMLNEGGASSCLIVTTKQWTISVFAKNLKGGELRMRQTWSCVDPDTALASPPVNVRSPHWGWRFVPTSSSHPSRSWRCVHRPRLLRVFGLHPRTDVDKGL